MKIAISGSHGYIAKNLKERLLAKNHSLIILERDRLYDPTRLKEILSNVDVVINLAGAPILRRWTRKNRIEIIKSRVETTSNIVQAINGLPVTERPKLLINASAIGIYSLNGDHSEMSASYAHDFVGEVVQQWENASSGLNPLVRKVIFRIGIIIGKEAKTIQNLLPVFKLGFGGKIGNGQQAFPFVHIDDVVNAICWTIEHVNAEGIYNLVAPVRINNKQFTSSLAKSVKRPAFFTVPEFALKIFLGEASVLLLKSPSAIPNKLVNEGFLFDYPDIKSSLAEIIA